MAQNKRRVPQYPFGCAGKQANERISCIHRRVTAIKSSREWERKYMTFGELLQKEHREGHQEGRTEMLLLTQKMLAAGESDKLSLLSKESFYREMCEKYGV